MVIIRKKIEEERQLQTRVNNALEQKKKNQQEQQQMKQQQQQNNGGKKSRKTTVDKKNKATLAEIEKMKGMKNIGKQNILLLGELEKQILKKGEASEDLEDVAMQGQLTAKKLRQIQNREVDATGEGESEDVDNALKQLLLLTSQQEGGEEEEDEWMTDDDEGV